ncbi:MAG TPA: hypothetical protein VL494_13600 [Steroidobacteraceae bacterium]|jgi:hypothetical protein|nr:hypothetical protein [Steroidobacteraceae bacterium]
MSAAPEIGFPSAVSALAKTSSVIKASDAEELRRYFRQGGLSVFNGSPTAALMARLSMFGRTAHPCPDCGGDVKRWIGGSGFVASSPKPREMSERQRALLAALEIFVPDGLLPPADDTVCRTCEGRGWSLPRHRTHSRAPITARPTGSSKRGHAGSAVDVNESDMALMGRVSGRLDRLRLAQGDLPASATLEAFFGPDGGTLGALWHLVASGKSMLRKNPNKLPPQQLWQNLRAEQSEKPTDGRAAQFKAADEQATALFQASCLLWNQVVR